MAISKGMIEADKTIKTNYIDEPKDWSNNKKVQLLFKRCRNSINTVNSIRSK